MKKSKYQGSNVNPYKSVFNYVTNFLDRDNICRFSFLLTENLPLVIFL